MAKFHLPRWLQTLGCSKPKTIHKPRPRQRLNMETLEDRVTPATLLWDGGGSSAAWSDPLNWNDNVHNPLTADAPVDLVFPSGITQTGTNNDLIGLTINSISFSGSGYDLDGNGLVLGGAASGSGYIVANAGAIDNEISLPIQLGGIAGNRQFFTVGTVGAFLEISGQLSGASGVELSKDGPGTLILSSDNSPFTGEVSIVEGAINIRNALALGTSAAATTVLSTVQKSGQLQVEDVNGDIAEPLFLNGHGPLNDGALLNISGINTWTGNIELDSDTTIGSNAGSLIINGIVSDTGAGHNLTKEGGATVVLDPINPVGTLAVDTGNSYRGRTFVNDGTLTIRHSLALGNEPTPVYGQNDTVVQSAPNRSGTLDLEFVANPDRIDPNVNVTNDGFFVPTELLTLHGPGFEGIHVLPKQPLPAGNTVHGALHNTDGINTWVQDIQLWSGDSSVVGDATIWNVNGVLPTVGIGAEATGRLIITGHIFDTFLSGTAELTTRPYSLVKVRPGRVQFVHDNTYRGRTEILEGYLNISDSQALGVSTLNDPRNGTFIFPGGTLELEADDIPDSVALTDPPHGLPHLPTDIVIQTENLRPLGNGANNDGAVRNIRGVNEIPGDIQLQRRIPRGGVAFNGLGASFGVVPDYNIGSPTQTFFDRSQLTLSGTIADDTILFNTSSNLSKFGGGELVLTNSNTYTGRTFISEGWITAREDHALGSIYNISVMDTNGAKVNAPTFEDLSDTKSPETYIAPGAMLVLKQTRSATPRNINLDERIFVSGDGIDHGSETNFGYTVIGGQLANLELDHNGAILNLGGDNTISGIVTIVTATGDTTVAFGADLDSTDPTVSQSSLSFINIIQDTIDTDNIGDQSTLPGPGRFNGSPVSFFGSYPYPVAAQPAGIEKLGRKRINLQGPGYFSGDNVVREGVLRVQNDIGLGMLTGTTTVIDGAALEIAGYNTTETKSPQPVEQYAYSVFEFSTQFSTGGGAASQANWDPDAPNGWAAFFPDGVPFANPEFLDFRFKTPVYATEIEVREFGVTGFVTQIELVDVNDVYHTIFSGPDAAPNNIGGILTVTFPITNYLVKGAKVTINPLPGGFERVDSIKLDGMTLLAPTTVAINTFNGGLTGGVQLRENLVLSGAGNPTADDTTNNLSSPVLVHTLTSVNNDNQLRSPISLPDVGSAVNISAAANSRLSLWKPISGVGGFTKEGDGKLVLGGINTYLGNTIINKGIVNLQSSSALGNPSVSETQLVTVTGGSGSFTLTFNGATTASLPFNATATAVQSALNGLSSIGGVGGSVSVILNLGTYSVTFGGALANTDLLPMTASGAGAAVATVSPQVDGGGGTVVANDAQIEMQGDITIGGEALILQGNGPNLAPNVPVRWFAQGPGAISDTSVDGNTVTGRVTGVATDPLDPNVIYLSAAGGGAWRTKNGGLTWAPLIDNINGAAVDQALFTGAIAVAPSNSSRIYVGLGETNNPFGDSYYGRGILKSADYGKTWNTIQPPGNAFDKHTISKIVVDPTEPDTIYVAVFGYGVNEGLGGNGNPANYSVWRLRNGVWQDLLAGVTTPIRFNDSLPTKFFPNLNNIYSDLMVWDINPRITSPLNGDVRTARLIAFAIGDPEGDTDNAVYVSNNADLSSTVLPTWDLAGFPRTEAGFPSRNGMIKLAGARRASNPNIVDLFASITYPDDSQLRRQLQLSYTFREVQATTYTINTGALGSWSANNITQPAAGVEPHGFYPNGLGWYDSTFAEQTQLVNIPWMPGGEGQFTLLGNQNFLFLGGTGSLNNEGPLVWNGSAWGDQNPGTSGKAPHIAYHASTFDSTGRLIVGTDGGIWRMENDASAPAPGANAGLWTNLNQLDPNVPSFLQITSFNNVDVHPFDPFFAIGGSQGNGIQTYDDSLIWTSTDGGNGGNGGIVQINNVNPNIVFKTEDGVLFRSLAGGVAGSWTSTGVGGANPYFPLLIDRQNPSRVLVGSGSNLLESNQDGAPGTFQVIGAASSIPNGLGSTGGGVFSFSNQLAIANRQGTWVLDPDFPLILNQGEDSYDSDTIYVLATGGVYVTKNHGSNWVRRIGTGAGMLPTTQGNYTDYSQIVVDPRDRDTAYVVRAVFNGAPGRHVYKTTDAGQNWTDISGNLPDLPTWSIAINTRNNDLYVGTDNGVYFLAGGAGGNWQRFGTGLPNAMVSSITFNALTNMLTVGTYGRGMYQLWLDDSRPDGGAIRAVSGSSVWTGPVTLAGDVDMRAEVNAQVNFVGTIADDIVSGGGNIYLTGHDILLHSGQNSYDAVILDYLRSKGTPREIPKASYDIAVIGSNLSSNYQFTGGSDFTAIAPASGLDIPLVGTLSGYGSAKYFQAGTGVINWTNIFSSYDALIILDDQSVGGGDLNAAGSAEINAQSAAIANAVNGGLDLWGGSGGANSNYYLFLPPSALATGSSIVGSTGFTATADGVAIGISDSPPSMINNFPTHNRFVNGAFDADFKVFETRTVGATTETISIGLQNAVIGAGGIGADGPHAINKIGSGRVVFSGANTFGGTVDVKEGALVVRSAGALGSPATPDGVTVVSASIGPAALELQSDLFRETVVLNGDGIRFNGHNTGALRSVSNNNTFTGTLILNTNTTIGVDSGSQLTIGTKVGDPTGAVNGLGTINDGSAQWRIIKELTGTLAFNSANTYDGLTDIYQGILRAEHSNALGSGIDGTQVRNGAQFQMSRDVSGNGITIVGETLRLSGTGIFGTGALHNVAGNNTWQGNVFFTAIQGVPAPPPPLPPGFDNVPGPGHTGTIHIGVANAGDVLTIDGPVGQQVVTIPAQQPLIASPVTFTDFEVNKVLPGKLVFKGPGVNDYTGKTTVQSGVLNIQKAQALGTTALGTFVVAGAALETEGNVTFVAETVTLNGRGVSPANLGALRNIGGINNWTGQVILNSTVASINEVQRVSVFGSAGTFTLTFNGSMTASMPFNVPASTVQNELNALSSIGGIGGAVTVTLLGNVYSVTFAGTLSGIDQPQLTGTGAGGVTLSINTQTNGSGPPNPLINIGADDSTSEVQSVTVTGTPGSFTLTFNGQTTPSLPADADAGQIQAALNGLASIGGIGGSVAVAMVGSAFTVTFGGVLGGANQPPLTSAVTGSVTVVVNTLTQGAKSELTISGEVRDSDNVVAGGFKPVELHKVGDGSIVFPNANTYRGLTQVDNGILNIRHGDALGAAGIAANGTIVNNGATLQTQNDAPEPGFTETNETLTLFGLGELGQGALANNGGVNTWSNLITLGDNNVGLGANFGSLIITGQISDAANTFGVAKVGPGIVQFGGTSDNEIQGLTTVIAGTLQLNKPTDTFNFDGPLTIGDNLPNQPPAPIPPDSAIVQTLSAEQIPDGSLTTINADGLLNLNNSAETINSLIINDGHARTGSGVLTIPTSLTMTGGNIELNGPGDQLLFGAGVIPAATSSATETAIISGNGRMAFPGVGRSFNVANGPLTVDVTIASQISGSGGDSFNKDGLGVLAITSFNVATYIGQIIARAGVLQVDGAVGDVLLNGGTLGGDGTIGDGIMDAITSQSAGGIVNPGAAPTTPGDLTTIGTVTWNSNTSYSVDLNRINPFPSVLNEGLDYDHLQVNGNLNLNGAHLIGTVDQIAGSSGVVLMDTFTIISYTGIRSGKFAEGDSVFIAGRKFLINYDDFNKQVVLTKIKADVTVDVTSTPGSPTVWGQDVDFTVRVTPEPGSGSVPAASTVVITLTNPETQVVTITGSSGTFTLTFNGQTTSALPFNATAAQVQTALNALSSIGGVGGSVVVERQGNVYTVSFGGSLDFGIPSLMTGNGAGGAGVGIVVQSFGPVSKSLSNGQYDFDPQDLFGVILDVGFHTVKADFQDPTNNFNDIDDTASASDTHQQQVNKAASTIVLVSSTAGGPEVQRVTVLGSSGTFTLTFNGSSTGSLAFNATATAVQTALNALPSIGGVGGSVTVALAGSVYTVNFGGALNGNNQTQMTGTASGGASVNITTQADGGGNTSVFGAPVTITARLGIIAPGGSENGTSVMTGTVTFTLDSGLQLPASNVFFNGSQYVATFNLPTNLSVSAHTISAEYSGDQHFNNVPTQSDLVQTVIKANSNVVVVAAPTPSDPNQNVTFTVTVSAANPSTGTPTGNVVIRDGGTVFGSAGVDASGVVTFQISTLTVGSHTIFADYQGDTNFNNNTGQTTHVVRGDTTTTVSSSPSPSFYGQQVTFSAQVNPVAPAFVTPTGTVDFFENGVLIPGGDDVTLNGSGFASFTFSLLSAGNHTITATYNGSALYKTSTGTRTPTPLQVVNKANTTVALAPLTGTTVYGQPVNFTATISITSPGGGMLAGTVDFLDSGVVIAGGDDVMVSGNTATFSTTFLGVGIHPNITAVYSGTANYNGNTSNAVSRTVTQASTNAQLTTSGSPSVYGVAEIKTTVTPVSPGGNVPVGTVTFFVTNLSNNQTTQTTITLDSNGAAVLTPHLNAGMYSIISNYNGNANYLSDQSNQISQQVLKANTSIALNTTNATAVYGEADITAIVSNVNPGPGIFHTVPTGFVTFDVFNGSTTTNHTVALDSSGVATLPDLDVGSYSITARFLTSQNFEASGPAGPLNQTVTPADSSVGVATNINPSRYGQTVTFTATISAVSPGSGTPPGTVAFSVDGNTVASNVALVNGQATHQISDLTVAGSAHTVVVSYSGSTNFNASSGSLNGGQTVIRGDTVTAVTSSQNPSLVGNPVTFTATISAVSPSVGTASGFVRFFIDSVQQVPDVAMINGQAQITTIFVTQGNHNVVADYLGDANFNTSNGSLVQNVKANSTTSVSSSADPSIFGQIVTFTATITPIVPVAPTGTVDFIIDGVEVASNVPMSSNTATFQISTLTVANSPHSITARYDGDVNYFPSQGTLPGGQDVNAAATSTAVSSNTPTVFGQSATFTATVTNTQTSATPAGSVTFVDITTSTNLGTFAVSGAGNTATAGVSTSGLSVSSHTIVATYNPSSNFTGSNASNVHVVNPANTTTAVVSSLNPSIFDQAVTFTATVAAQAPGAGTPTGSVRFFIDGVAQAPDQGLSGGQATFTISLLSVGTHTVSAQYLGNANFIASTGNLAQDQQVKTNPVVFAVFPGSVVSGKGFMVVVHVRNANNTGIDTSFNGPVLLEINSGPVLGSFGTVNASAGVATFNLSLARAGSYSLRSRIGNLPFVVSPNLEVTASSILAATTPSKIFQNQNFSIYAIGVDVTGQVAPNYSGFFTVTVVKKPAGARVTGNKFGNFAGGFGQTTNLKVSKAGIYTFRVNGPNGLVRTFQINIRGRRSS